MRLYKMELYKLCHRKIFVIGAICVIGILLISFCLYVSDELATVDGIRYTGYKAVQVNRRITEEFSGVLTDEKVEKIVEKYGFPQKVEEGWNYFRDGNFLNQFVMSYLSDGYMYSWTGDYKVAENVCLIADSDLGAVKEITGQEIILEYYQGWNVFLELTTTVMVLGSILILFGISVIFANEGQTKMLQLIFTTKEGREKEVYAKIAAAMTVAVSVWTVIFVLDLLLCGIVYGLDGLDCYNGMVTGYLFPASDRMIPMRSYITEAIMLSFFGIISLCAITIYVSARSKNNFHAVVIAAVYWGAPVLAAIFTDGFHGFSKILSAAPIFMVIHEVIGDIYNIWVMPLIIAILVSIICTIRARRKYRRQQAA
ncbi:MAG: ABC transporter permease [Lachnospiraceae bacterium]|nr:ABC transporter permease [Lachnospiraceae bacterium]